MLHTALSLPANTALDTFRLSIVFGVLGIVLVTTATILWIALHHSRVNKPFPSIEDARAKYSAIVHREVDELTRIISSTSPLPINTEPLVVRRLVGLWYSLDRIVTLTLETRINCSTQPDTDSILATWEDEDVTALDQLTELIDNTPWRLHDDPFSIRSPHVPEELTATETVLTTHLIALGQHVDPEKLHALITSDKH